MKFVDRKEELSYLKESKALSDNKLFSVSLSGLRRVGKTRLILELLEKSDLYLFVNKDKTSESLLMEYQEILRNKGILTELESLKNWDDFFRIIFERFKGIIAFDEFQNFTTVNKSVFGILQKQMDLNEQRRGLLFILSGSLIGLIKKLFSDKKEPLYGRVKRKMRLKPLSFKSTLSMCREVDIEDIEQVITLYSIFGGFPKYYVAIEDENLKGASIEKILQRFFFVENAALEDEVAEILSLEFGKRSGIYYDILTAIANGSTRISEIAAFLGKKETALTRQIGELINYFELVEYEEQAVGKRKLLYITHPLMAFWFKHFYKSLSSYRRRDPWAIEKIKSALPGYVGRRFEQVCREFLHSKSPFKFERIGRQWGKFRGQTGKNTYEIDIVALNESTKQILFCECKWQDKADARAILAKLKEKVQHVQWHNEKRKEHYVIFARSFKERIKEPNLMLFDLKDMERIFRWARPA